MPAVCRARRLSRPVRLVSLLMSAALLTAPRASVAAEPEIKVLNAAGSLILDAPGKKAISFKIPAQKSAAGTNLVLALYRYDANATLMAAPVASYRTSIAAAHGDTKVSINVDLPSLGLFLVDAKLISARGATLKSTKFNVAAISKVEGNSFPGAGVVTHFAQLKGSPGVVLPLVKKAGFTWIRDELYWSSIERHPNQFLFPPEYLEFLTEASNLEVKPLIVLDYGNPGAYPDFFKGPQGFPQTEEERKLFVRYVGKVVSTYGDKVKHWEVWNEPMFAGGYASYVSTLKEVYVAIKKLSPDATVISCGGGGAGGGPSGDCITSIIDAGAARYQDGFSVHPYMSPYPPETGYRTEGSVIDAVNIPTVWPHLSRMLAANTKANQGRFKLWITELGWPSSPQSAGLSESAQAANVVRTYLLSRRYNAVEAIFWYDFVDDGVSPDDKEANFGLLRADLSPKPAYVAAAVLARTLGSRSWDHALVDTDAVKVYQYGASDQVIVGWLTDKNARTTAVRIPPGNYVQRDWQGVTSDIVIPTQGLDWQLGPLPKYLIPASRDH